MAEEDVPYTGRLVSRAEAKAAGLPRFFTGRQCRRGHIAQRMTANEGCFLCQGLWKASNRGKVNASNKASRARNLDVYKASVERYLATPEGQAKRRAYYVANAEGIKAASRKSAMQNPDAVRERQQAWYRANIEEAKQRAREWNAANPEATRARSRNYRALSKGAEGRHEAADIKALYIEQAGLCVYCGTTLGDNYHVDHIQPLARGGSNWPANLQLACARCNNHKRATDPAEYLRRLALKPTP